ncbi:MAG: sirohydrochlorin chelatase [Acidimicrobiales bacterium]
MTADLLLVGHGSRRGEGCAEMEHLRDLVEALAGPEWGRVRLGYLELAQPAARRVMAQLAGAGARRVVVVPLMLHAAGHAKSDVAAVVLDARRRFPGVDIAYGRALGVDHALLQLGRRRLAATGALGLPLAVLSRGTSDPDANAEAYKVARLLAELSGTRLVVPGFSGLTWPTVPEALADLGRSRPPRVAVLAWFLATGVLVERMRRQCTAWSAETGIEVVDAGHLGADATVAELILERAAEAAAHRVAVNCDACVHRRPWPGLEDRLGAELGVGHSHLAADHLHDHTGHLHT